MKILMVVYDNDMHISWFPQGLAYLSAVAREEGHEVEIYQQDVYHWPEKHLTDYLDKNEIDVVAVSIIAGYYQYKKLLKISDAINSSINREKFKYLLGGHGPAPDPEFFLHKTKADFICIGEGENTFIELLQHFENKKEDYKSIDGIAFLDKNKKYIRTKRRELISNIDDIPFPAYDLFDISHYSLLRTPHAKSNQRVMSVLSGRGCKFKCNFCYRLDKGFRPRSAESIIEEIKLLKEKYNISYIHFSDELLMSSQKRTIDLCNAFIDADLDINWDCNGRLNYADYDVIKKMKEAGCVFITYGIESLDDNTLKVMHKALTKKMIERGIKNTLKAGISPGFMIIYGNIDEPMSAIDDALDFLKKYNDHVQLRTIRPVTPYPGTELFDIAVERGLVKDVEDFYENIHLNSDLYSVNFTKYSFDEVHDALYRANMILIDRQIDFIKNKWKKECKKLYKEKNINFRGFR